LQAHFSDRAAVDLPLRLLLAIFALATLLNPSELAATVTAVPVCRLIAYD
jgi:hypothetical protein